MEWAQPRTHSKRVTEGQQCRPRERFHPRVKAEEGAQGRALPAGLYLGLQLFVSAALSFTLCRKHATAFIPGQKAGGFLCKQSKQVVWEC